EDEAIETLTSGQRVIARSSIQNVASVAAAEIVGESRAGQLVVANSTVDERHARYIQQTAEIKHVSGRRTDHATVISVPAFDRRGTCVEARKRDVGCAGNLDGVEAGPSAHHVALGVRAAKGEYVVTCSTIERVLPSSAGNLIVAVIAIDGVVAGSPAQII